MAVTDLHTFGWRLEERLKPKLDELFGESVKKIEGRYSTYDFETSDYFIELKSRRAPVTEDTYVDWLVPACKFKCADKLVVCFYYFEATQSLYYIIFCPSQFSRYKITPNRNSQLTYHIPKDDWTKV